MTAPIEFPPAVRDALPLPLVRAARAGRRGYRMATAPLRPLPHFLLIGAQKAGTTSLYQAIAQHPQVVHALGKGVHYFDEHAHRSTTWYRSNFPVLRDGKRRRGGEHKLTGEASPEYLPHPLAPGRVAALMPDVRLLVVLRDPVDRAISHYHHSRAIGLEPLGLEEALSAEPERLAGELERLRADPHADSVALRHHSYIARGRYAEQLTRWLDVFADEQLLVLRFEDLVERPEAVLRAVFGHLGLPAAVGVRMPRLNARTYERVAPTVLAHLREQLAAAEEELVGLLGPGFRWGD
jgi:hypothetical protein